MKKFSSVLMVGLATAALVAGSSAAHASVVPEAAEPIELLEQLNTSVEPFVALDAMSESEQQILLQEFDEMETEQVAEIFAPNGQMSVSAAASAGMLNVASPAYSDIAWSWLEKAACVIHVDLVSCNRAAKDANNASASAKKLFPKSLHNGRGDAYRHCYWNALMTISIGENGAMKIASNHEAVRNGPAREKKMDLANNKTGRSVGKAQKTASKSSTKCKSLANQNKLVTL